MCPKVHLLAKQILVLIGYDQLIIVIFIPFQKLYTPLNTTLNNENKKKMTVTEDNDKILNKLNMNEL